MANRNLILRKRRHIGILLNELNLLGYGAEVGVYKGTFSYQILHQWRGKGLYLIDPWSFQDDYLDSWNASDDVMQYRLSRTTQILSRFKSRIKIIRQRSDQAHLLFPNNFFDFIYIDANHAYDAVKSDLHNWFPKLRAGGLFSGHDYFDALPDENLNPIISSDAIPRHLLTSYGVKTAVDEFATSLGVTVSIVHEKYPSWYFIKP